MPDGPPLRDDRAGGAAPAASAARGPAGDPAAAGTPGPFRPVWSFRAFVATVAGKPVLAFVLLLLVSLAVRLATIAFIDPERPPIGDEPDYRTLAQNLAWGRGFSLATSVTDIGGPHQPTAFRPPLFPFLLAPVARAFESLPGSMIGHLRIFNLFVGAFCAPVAFLALRRSPLRERALVPAAALAVWPPAVFLSSQLLAEPLAMSLSLASIAWLPAPGDARPRRPFLAGVVAGLTVLARPSSLLSGALVGLTVRRVAGIAWFALGAAVIVAPWLARNQVLLGRPALTTNSGVTLVGANNHRALGERWPGKWMEPQDVYADAPGGPVFGLRGWAWTESGEPAAALELPADTRKWEELSDRRFAADAWGWITSNPGAYVTLCGFKLLRLFDPDQHSNKPDARAKAIVGWATYLPVLLLALAGARLAWRDRRAWAPWFGLCGGVVATTLVFYGDVRMRSPMDPALLAFATLAAFALRNRFRGARPAAG